VRYYSVQKILFCISHLVTINAYKTCSVFPKERTCSEGAWEAGRAGSVSIAGGGNEWEPEKNLITSNFVISTFRKMWLKLLNQIGWDWWVTQYGRQEKCVQFFFWQNCIQKANHWTSLSSVVGLVLKNILQKYNILVQNVFTSYSMELLLLLVWWTLQMYCVPPKCLYLQYFMS
jgi:hypothetical protein